MIYKWHGRYYELMKAYDTLDMWYDLDENLNRTYYTLNSARPYPHKTLTAKIRAEGDLITSQQQLFI